MLTAPLSERLEHAILLIVSRNPSDATQQGSLGRWRRTIQPMVNDFGDSDLLLAFKCLWNNGIIRLTKPNTPDDHTHDYSDNELDDQEFFQTTFSATLTYKGRTYWEQSEARKATGKIGNIGEEKSVAVKLHALIRRSCPNAFDLFVLSSPGSLGPQFTDILKEVSPTRSADVAHACQEINDVPIELPTNKLALEMEIILGHMKTTCYFRLVNNGNQDVEPTEVTLWIPAAILISPFRPAVDPAILEVREKNIAGMPQTEIVYRNYRKPLTPNRISKAEPLVNLLLPGMRPKLQYLFFDVRLPLQEHELENPIRYQITCKNMKLVDRTITLKDKLIVPDRDGG